MLLIRITLPWVSSGLAKVPGASKKRITRRPRQGFGRQRLVIWTHTVETSSCPFMRTHGMWFFFQCLVFYVGNRQLIHIYFHVGSHTSNFKLNLIHLIFNVNGQSNPTFIGYHSATQEYRPEHVSGQLEERIAPSAFVRLHIHESPDDQTGRAENQRSHQLLWWILIKSIYILIYIYTTTFTSYKNKYT
jgi:hypothetical protein